MQQKFAMQAGQMDLARQMEPLDFIFEFIDFAFQYHYNTVFLYLEWRIRTETLDIGAGKGYAKDEMRQIVRYALEHGMTVIPGLAPAVFCSAGCAPFTDGWSSRNGS